jgi:hypothetical protein
MYYVPIFRRRDAVKRTMEKKKLPDDWLPILQRYRIIIYNDIM